VAEEDGDDEIPAEAGSFFNFFEIAVDPFDVSVVI
jgi:template-activating factor I